MDRVYLVGRVRIHSMDIVYLIGGVYLVDRVHSVGRIHLVKYTE